MNKRPLIYCSRVRDYYFVWIWKISLIWITNAEHTNPNKFFENWNGKAKAIIFGKYGIGIGNSFGL